MQESSTVVVPSPASGYTSWQGLVDVFINPSRLGKAVLQKPMRLIPAILIAVIYFVMFYLI